MMAILAVPTLKKALVSMSPTSRQNRFRTAQAACPWPSSFRRPRRPVDHHRQRRVRLRLHRCVDQKPLPVGRYGIGRKEVLKSRGAELEERDRRARLEALAPSHRPPHQLPIPRVVEHLPPIPPPAWTVAPAGRDLPLATAPREALHVDLVPARRIRGVG